MAKEIQDVEERVRRGVVEAASVSGLIEKQEPSNQIQDVETKVRAGAADTAPIEQGQALAGTLAEFYEAQAQWGREISAEEKEKMIEEVSRSKTARVVKRLEHKLFIVSMSCIIPCPNKNCEFRLVHVLHHISVMKLALFFCLCVSVLEQSPLRASLECVGRGWFGVVLPHIILRKNQLNTPLFTKYKILLFIFSNGSFSRK